MSEVQDLRVAAGLTQDELAARSGVAQPNIAAYENGRRNPSAAMLDRLRAAAKPRPSVVLARHRASRVRVFGSTARGEDVSGGDLDLLVRFAPDADLFDLADLSTELSELTGLHVDVVSERGLQRTGARIIADARPL